MSKRPLPKAIHESTGEPAGTASTQDAPAAAPTSQRQPAIHSKPAEISDLERHRALAQALVKRYAFWSGAAGLIPFPVVDLATVGGVQVQMLRRLSQVFDIPFSENRGKALIASLAGVFIPASSGIGAASMVKTVPVIGTTVAIAAMPTLSAGATFAIGMAFIEHFASGGTLLDFKPSNYLDVIKRQKK
jgi:uncharacterized protein (DUF697 family)